MRQLLPRNLDAVSCLLLGAFLFFLAVYSKQFAYLNVQVGGIPLYISEFTLVVVSLLRVKRWREVLSVPRAALWLALLFLAWGFARLGMSLAAGLPDDITLVETLKQTCLFYQVVWFFLPFLFAEKELRAIVSVALLGAGVAQALGWLGFMLFGIYGSTFSRLLGFPVGNEVLLALYPLTFVLWSYPAAAGHSLSFGLLWVAQFLIYMKRTWVFSVLVFSLPVVLLRSSGTWGERIKRILIPAGVSVVLAALTIYYVNQRGDENRLHHAHESASAAERANMPSAVRLLLRLVDEIFPYTDPLETQISMSRVVFKGDLLTGNGATPSFMAFRMHLWRQAWAGFLEHPVVGRGFGNHMMETQLNGLPAVVDGRWISGPHNSYLAILNRLGVVGFLFFVGLVTVVVWHCRWRQLDNLGWVLVAALLNVHFFSLFNVCLENPQSGIWYWLFLGMSLKIFFSRSAGIR